MFDDSSRAWFTGYGIEFGAYVDWEDLKTMYDEPNIVAYMPVASDTRPLLGKDTEVSLDDGNPVTSMYNEDNYLIFGSDINGDGVTNIRNVLFADSLHNTYTSWPSADIELHRWVAVSQWNTLTLPFSMTAQQVADVFGEDTQVAAFQGDSCKTLQFVILPSSRIEAGVPYLIHPARDVRVIRLHGVSLSSECHAKSIKGTDYTFIGTLNQEHPAEGSVYLAAANHTKTLVAGGSIKAFRAYFANKSGNAVGLTIESKQPLGILSIHHDTYGKSADFSITGQRVGTSYKGIIVRKGHKFLAR